MSHFVLSGPYMSDCNNKELRENVFRCDFSEVPLFSRLYVWISAVVISGVIISVAGGIVGLLVGVAVLIVFPVFWEIKLVCIIKKSTICLTRSNDIVIKIWPRRIRSYPIEYIEKIIVVDFESENVSRRMKDYVLPVTFGRGGDDIIPQKGVLVFFKRQYVKSVRPVFFNPSEPELFAKELSERCMR